MQPMATTTTTTTTTTARTPVTRSAASAPTPPRPAPAPPPSYRLYDRYAVALATFLGTPAAGGVLLAMNYRRLGRPERALLSVVLAILATALLIAVGLVLPNK